MIKYFDNDRERKSVHISEDLLHSLGIKILGECVIKVQECKSNYILVYIAPTQNCTHLIKNVFMMLILG